MADIIWTGTGDGTSWSDAANWDSGIVPTVSDNVTVNVDVNITTNVDIQVTQLNLLAGTLTSTGNTSWGGNFEVAETASIQLSGETQTFAIGTNFNGLGVVELASGALDIDDQVSIKSKFKSNSNSQVKVKNNLKLEGDTEISGLFDLDETAIVELSGQTHNFASGCEFSGLGVVNLAAGELNVDEQVSIKSKFKSNSNSQVKVKNNLKLEGDSEIGGACDIAENASLELIGQTHTFTTGSTFTGVGILDFISGELSVADEVSIQSKFKSKSTLKVQNKLMLEGESEISGACDIAENASLELSGQTHTFAAGSIFTGTGVVDFLSGELNVTDEVSIQSKFNSKSTLKVQNKLMLEGESEISGACDIAENASLELSGQTHTFTAGSSFSGMGVVDLVAGELSVADEVSIQSKFKSKGTVKVQNKLTLENDSEISGVCDIAENATLEFAQGAHVLNAGTSFTGEGKLVLSDGTLTVNDTINANIFEVKGGTVTGAGQIIAETQIETLGATLSEGKTKVITNEFLQVTDADTSADQIVYTLTDLPDAGALLLNGVSLGLNATFTQADIDNNLLTYADGTSVSLSDSFGFDITVNGELITSSSFGFEIGSGSGSIAEFRDTGTAGIFAFTDASASATLKFSVDDSSNPSSNNEIGVFAVDDDKGTINGIAPGSQGYLQAALSRAKVISSVLENEPKGFDAASRLLEFQGSDRLGFYLVTEGTTDMAIAELAGGKTPSNISFSTSKNLQVSDFTSGSFTLNWEEQANGGNGSFKDVVLNVESVDEPLTLGTQLQANGQGEVLDLRSLTGQASASFTINREAQFDNVVGLYAIQNEQGAVLDKVTGQLVNPGDANYAKIAIQQRLNIDLSVANQGTANLSSQLDGGVIFAPFIIADATANEFLAENPNNTAGQGPQAYFAFLGANSDGADHVSLLGNNTFGFEDLPGAGDKDYNDIVLKIDLTVA